MKLSQKQNTSQWLILIFIKVHLVAFHPIFLAAKIPVLEWILIYRINNVIHANPEDYTEREVD